MYLKATIILICLLALILGTLSYLRHTQNTRQGRQELKQEQYSPHNVPKKSGAAYPQ